MKGLSDNPVFERFTRECARAKRLGMAPKTVEASLRDKECLVLALNEDGSPVCWVTFRRPDGWTSAHEAEAERFFSSCLAFGCLYSDQF